MEGLAAPRAGWGSSGTGEATQLLMPQQLKILQAIVTGNKVTGVFLELSPLPSALPPSWEALCPLHPAAALWRVGRASRLPPDTALAAAVPHFPSCTLCYGAIPIPLLSSNSLHSTNGPELPHSSPHIHGVPYP